MAKKSIELKTFIKTSHKMQMHEKAQQRISQINTNFQHTIKKKTGD